MKLPDFLAALEAYEASPNEHESMTELDQNRSISPERPASRASSHASHSAGKLRYRAYDTPKATPRLRPHHPDSTTRPDSRSSWFIGQGSDVDDSLSKTVTAGDLTIVSGRMELQDLSKRPRSSSPDVSLAQAAQAVQSLNLNHDEPVYLPLLCSFPGM